MKSVFAFMTSFAAVLLVTAIVRGAILSRDERVEFVPASKQPRSHNHSTPEFNEAPPADNRAAPPESPVKPAEAVELGNDTDPVSGVKLGSAPAMLVHKSWRIGFESEANGRKFDKNPMRYYARLSLEPTTDGRLLKVDGSSFEKALASECPIMGGEIDPDGEVFIFHRGFKIYFCCWSGCPDEFLADAKKHYAHYGLVERDGKLVRK